MRKNKNEDRPEPVECAACGEKVPLEDSFECPKCWDTMCKHCFNKDLNTCYDCLDDEYREEPNVKGLGKFHSDE
jgi:predicted RNA-binding Zn-ribbon protein involved in translation (DUF1610 family)